MSRLPAFHRVHLCRCAGSFGAILLTLAKMDKIPCLLSALSLCLWRIACKYGSISRFKGVFSAVWGFRVGLCCLGGLRGLCGFCTRVELGGYMACGDFLQNLSFCPFVFLSCPAFACSPAWFPALPAFLLCLVFLALWLFGCGCCFLFPFGICAKRKGARCCPCVLSSIVILIVTFYISFIRLCQSLSRLQKNNIVHLR